jgi:hypothetical protein
VSIVRELRHGSDNEPTMRGLTVVGVSTVIAVVVTTAGWVAVTRALAGMTGRTVPMMVASSLARPSSSMFVERSRNNRK